VQRLHINENERSRVLKTSQAECLAGSSRSQSRKHKLCRDLPLPKVLELPMLSQQASPSQRPLQTLGRLSLCRLKSRLDVYGMPL
jgi:hypothetical protein